MQRVWLGWVMDRCWSEAVFKNAHELVEQLELVKTEFIELN